MLFQISGQLDLNGLQSLGFSTGSSHFSFLFPGIRIVHISLPAIGLHMGSISNISFVPRRNIVNLDFDLYQPILSGLRFFYPKMLRGSVILVHDYYHAGLPGIREAIKQYEKEIGREISKLPIGDNQSIALLAQ